jgi:hypothetical protein
MARTWVGLVRWHAMVSVIAAITISALLMSGVGEVAGDGGRGPRDLVELLASRDLVVEGNVIEVVEGRRWMLGGCASSSPLGPYAVMDVRMDVSRVLSGIADDSTMRIGSRRLRGNGAHASRIGCAAAAVPSAVGTPLP